MEMDADVGQCELEIDLMQNRTSGRVLERSYILVIR